MKKILFGITSLTLGGAERVLVDLANALSDEYEITILTIYDGGILKKQLNPNIHTISIYDKAYKEFSKIEKIKISLKLIFKDKAPEGYDTYVAFLEGPITRLFSKVKNNKKIAWIHNDISKVFGNGIKGKLKKRLDKKIYNSYDQLIFVSEENREDFCREYGKNNNEKIIRNYLDYEEVIKKADEQIKLPFEKNDINIVTVCRLTEQKGIDRFINVHSKLEKTGMHSKVYIVGDGPLRYSLQKQIDELGETENFYLLGEKTNPYPYIKNADYFCLLSYYEGYGMVIEEAKILDKTVIITDTAARESILNYEKGIIAPNTEKGIYETLKDVIKENKHENVIDQKNNINSKYYEKILKEVKEVL